MSKTSFFRIKKFLGLWSIYTMMIKIVFLSDSIANALNTEALQFINYQKKFSVHNKLIEKINQFLQDFGQSLNEHKHKINAILEQ